MADEKERKNAMFRQRKTGYVIIFFLFLLWFAGNPGKKGTDTENVVRAMGAAEFSVNNTVYEIVEGCSSYVRVTDDPGNLQWKVKNPSVCQVFDGQIIGLKSGETTVTVTDGTHSEKLKVTVRDYEEEMSLNTGFVVLYPGETFQLYCAEESSEVKWSTGNSEVALVSKTGKVRAKSVGTTYVEANYGVFSSTCSILVVEKSDKFVRLARKNNYTVTTKRTVYEADRFLLIADAGIYLPEGFLNHISLIMDEIESETGYSFYPANYFVQTPGRLEIYVTNTKNSQAYSSASRVTISQEYLLIEEGFGYTIAHELLRNTGSIGDILLEGFAETYGMRVMEALHFPNYHDEEYKQRLNIARQYPKLTIGNVREFLAGKAVDHHPTSYFFVSFLNETVDSNQMRLLHEKAEQAGSAKRKEMQSDPSEYRDWEEINYQVNLATIQAIRAELGDSVIAEFMKWYNKKIREFSVPVYDAKENERVTVGAMDAEILSFGVYTRIRYQKRLVVDYQNAIAYLVQYKGQKYKGLYGYMTGTGTVKFYDKSGKLVVQYTLQDGVRTKIAAPGAVKYAVSKGEDLMFDISMAKCFEGLLY